MTCATCVIGAAGRAGHGGVRGRLIWQGGVTDQSDVRWSCFNLNNGGKIASRRFVAVAICSVTMVSSAGYGAGDGDATASPEAIRQFGELRAAQPAGEISGELELAIWAAEHGLPDKAEEIFRWILDHDPLNEKAYKALIELAGNRTPPKSSDALDDARAVLPKRFVEFETKRFVVLSDAEAQWTRRQASRLERTHHQFQRFARRLKLRPLPLKHKLVCVLFRDRADYQRFAISHDEVVDPWIAGYYSPAHGRVVFYRSEVNPSVVEAREKLKQMRADIEVISNQMRQAEREGKDEWAETLRQNRARYRAHLQRESDRVDKFTEQVNVATTMHETTHQLLFHTGVQSARTQYPIWVSEGFATSFETDNSGGAFGPDHEYGPRREVFEEHLRAGKLIELSKLVMLTSVANGNGETVSAVYHQSYALVTWMSRYRKKELRQFLDLMLAEPGGAYGGDRYLELFEQAFSDVDRLESAWLRHERSRVGK